MMQSYARGLSRARNGILCLESAESERRRGRSSVMPVLDAVAPYGNVRCAYRLNDDAATLLSNIELWLASEKYRRFPILYLSTHGKPGKISVGSEIIHLSEIAEVIDGRGAGRAIHFSACSALAISREKTQVFLAKTRLTAISGFREDVDWLQAISFEMILLDQLAQREIRPVEMREALCALRALTGRVGGDLGFTLNIRT